MLRVRVSTASAEIIETELITTGRRGLECAFEFNSAWDGLAKTVIVNGVVKRDIVLVSDTITVPGECLAREQFPLRIGVYGANGAGEIVIPTIWANFGKILPSARPSGIDPDEVTPDVVAQIQTNSSDALRLAQEVLRRADSGEFNGRDGATGPRGPSGADGRDGAPGNSIWWAPTSARIVDAFVTLESLSGRQSIPPQAGDLVFFEDYEVYVISIVGQYRAAIDRLGSIIGPKGDQGDAFTYEDFTEAQLAALTGPQGPAGNPGDDGFSPVVAVATITGGHRVTITDAQGDHIFDVMDGEGGGSVEEVYWATYNTTTEAEITTAVTAGKTVLCKISDEIFYLASKAAIGPSGSAWIFASANQTSMRVTWVSGSYWNSIGTRTIPTKTSDLTNDSGFVNASGAAAAAPVQSVNGQTGAVTVGGAAYFPFTISEGTVTPGTGVTPQAIYQAYTDGKAVFAVIEPELEIDDEQILPLEWINELPSTYSIWFSVVYGNVNFDLIYSVGRWHTQTRRLYEKPQTGIPKFDLASDVQASLGKADTALQSFTETDPTVPSWAKASSKPSYTASEVGAIAAPASPSTGDFLCWNGSAWAATTLATWQGGSY